MSFRMELRGFTAAVSCSGRKYGSRSGKVNDACKRHKKRAKLRTKTNKNGNSRKKSAIFANEAQSRRRRRAKRYYRK